MGVPVDRSPDALLTADKVVPNKPAPRLFTIEQAATELNIGQPLIRALLKNVELRGFQLGGRSIWRIGADDLQNYIDDAYRKTGERIAAGDLDESPTEEV
ncbi:helix-turn-helix domain-containing protein [Arthrobacter sp. 2MCAF14]|uniref:helix-turn-helix domain-containing protein n=1 Tax=Arthrobacter sp. 2MCAF14 TaxID=3232982 RepID=UPI003F931AF8